MPHDNRSLSLFLAHRAALVDYAAAIVGCRVRAEDLVQEAWLRFNAATTRPIEQPIGYLYRIVRNLAFDWSRRASLEGRVVESGLDLLEPPLDRPSPEDEALHREELQLVMQALAELPPRTRLALEMHRFDGYKLREIAEHLGLSVATVHGLVYEGLDHCRRALRRKP